MSYLAVANARAKSRRLSSATTPLIMGVTMAAAQIFSATTLAAAAQDQAVDGMLADHVVTASSDGISPELADRLAGRPGVGAVAPVVRTQTIVTYSSDESQQYKAFPTQGVDGDDLAEVMDLGVLDGDIAALRGDTVALSRIASGTIGARIGDTIDVHMGDGTLAKSRVVAIYEKGLGFGDLTLPHDVTIRHTTDHLDSWVLVKAAQGTAPSALGDTLRSALAASPTAGLADRESFMAAQSGDGSGDSAVSLILNAVLLGYIAIGPPALM